MFKFTTTFIVLNAAIAALSAPLVVRHEGHDHSATNRESGTGLGRKIQRENAFEAQKLNNLFDTIKPTDACKAGAMACVNGGFAQCIGGKWTVQQCSNGLKCYALPLVLQRGTSLVCDTEADAISRFDAAGVAGGIRGNSATPANTGDDDEDDDDIPFCDEVDEDDTDLVNAGSDAMYKYYYPRQAEPEPSTLATLPPFESSTESATPTSTNPPINTPTVVIGSDGIVTVTVVSTAFATTTVTASDCGVPTASSSATPITVSRATSSAAASASSTVAASSSAPSVSASASSSGSPSSSASASSSAAPSTVVTLVVGTQTSESVAPTETKAKGGFEFTTADSAAPTDFSGYY